MIDQSKTRVGTNHFLQASVKADVRDIEWLLYPTTAGVFHGKFLICRVVFFSFA